MTIISLPDTIKKYLSSHIENIVKLGIDYINLNIENLSEDDVDIISSYNNDFTFGLNLKENPYKLVFRKKVPYIINMGALTTTATTNIITTEINMPLYNLSEINQNGIYIQDNDNFTWQLPLPYQNK